MFFKIEYLKVMISKGGGDIAFHQPALPHLKACENSYNYVEQNFYFVVQLSAFGVQSNGIVQM